MIKDFTILQFAHSNDKRVTPLNYYKEHVHKYYELIYIINGSGRFLIEDVEYIFEKDSAFLIPPGKYHVMTKLPDKDYERVIVYFSSEHLPPQIENRLYFQRACSLANRQLIEKYCNYYTQFPDEVFKTLLKGFISELILTEFYGNQISNHEKSYVPPLIKSAIEYINENIDKPLTTKIIADALFVSNTHLGHVFSSVMNGGIMHYVQIKKIYKAQELLKKGHTATAVAEMLGYKSYPTFIRNYKTYLGTIPSQDKIQ